MFFGDANESLTAFGSLQGIGILNALRTGDPTMDMLLALSLPLLIKLVMTLFSGLSCEHFSTLDFWTRLFLYCEERIIEHKSTRDAYGCVNDEDEDAQNTVLMKAIKLYLHRVLNISLRDAQLDLTSTDDKRFSSKGSGRYDYDSDSDDEHEDDSDSKTLAGALSKYSIVRKPLVNCWHQLGDFGKLQERATVSLRIEVKERNSHIEGHHASSTHITNRFRLRSKSGLAIDHFVNTAYKWYMDELRQLEDNSRYHYELKSTPQLLLKGYSDGKERGIVYTRYRLSDEKTFESLFFQQKQSLLRLLNHFLDKSGKYAVKGYPHKLGVLLHGPPGSGKTSLIKAMAEYTGRSIINVPLARISTNAELMSIFFDPRKYIDGEKVPVKLGFKDVIYVMEDIDAASKIVKRRDGGNPAALTERTQPNTMDLLPTKCLLQMLLESNDSDCMELVEKLMERSDKIADEVNRSGSGVLLNLAQRAVGVPALSLQCNSTIDPTTEQAHEDALVYAENAVEEQSTVDRYLAKHARAMNNILDLGAKVSDDIVDELLGHRQAKTRGFCVTPNCHSPTDENPENILAEDESKNQAILMATLVQMSKFGEQPTRDAIPLSATVPSIWGRSANDQLNLTGLLNVLDGVVDSPRRIVIRTTNHVDQLDPALIRPGRMDKKLLLGFMEPTDVVLMIEHYFVSKLDDVQQRRVLAAMTGKSSSGPQKLTPAQVEQLTAEHDDIEDMIATLEERSRL